MSVLFTTCPWFALAVLTILVSALTACDNSPTQPSPNPGPSPDVTVTIQGNRGNQSYAPSPVTVRVGQTVGWRNADSATHTSTQDGGGFNTGNIASGATSTPIAMNTAGTFPYHCAIHPGMTGIVTVQ